MVNLSQYRWKKAVSKLNRRMSQAEKVLNIYDDRHSSNKLRFNALMDLMNELPELRRLRRESRYGNLPHR